MSKHPFRLRVRRRAREGPPRARRVRLGRPALRPHERPDVHGPASRMEGLHGAGGQRAAGLSRCWTSPAAPATWRWPSPRRSAPPARWCTPTSTRPCCAPGATGCSTPASSLPTLVCDAEKLPFAGRPLRPRQRGLRPAQHDPQGRGAGGDEPGAQAGRQAAGAGVFQGRQAAGEGLRLVFVQGAAAAGQAGGGRRAPATATWPSRSACIPARKS